MCLNTAAGLMTLSDIHVILFFLQTFLSFITIIVCS